MTARRVAVTGLGVVAPCGVGAPAFWEGLFRAPPGGDRRELLDWDPLPYFDNKKDARRSDRFSQFALAAAAEALAQAGDLDVDPIRIGSLIGTGIGGINTNEDEIVKRHEKGDRRVSPFLVPMMMPNAAAASVSMRHGLQGPVETTVTACSAGTHAIGNAANLIRYGRCDAVVTGGSEAPLSNTAIAGFRNMTAMSNQQISMPFDVRRDGFIIAEGCAVLVLEEWEHAKARGATILAEVLGAASSADAHHITAPAPGGSGALNVMKLALQDAGLEPSDITHVNAHGTSTPLNDAAEAHAYGDLFGTDPGPIVTSTKGVTGHALGAAGALEAAAVILAMQNKRVPPTLGFEQADPELPDLNLSTGEGVEWEPGPAISNSFGFGGHNGSLILGPSS